MGNHQTGRTIFQIAVQTGFFQRGSTQQAVDVKSMKESQQSLHFALVHGAMFQIEPDAVVSIVSRLGDKGRIETTQ